MRYKKKGGVAPGSGKTQLKQYSAKPERGSGKGWVGGQGKRRGLTGLSGSGGLEKGKSFEM